MSDLIQLSNPIPVVAACRRFPAGLASVLACSRTAGQLHSGAPGGKRKPNRRIARELKTTGCETCRQAHTFMRAISGLSCLLLLIAAAPLTQSQSSPAQNPGDAKAAPTVHSQVPQANALYIQGLDHLSKSNTWMEGGSLVNAREAVRLFSQAVKKDPQFTLAYLGLADAWDSFGFSVPGSVPAVKLYPHEIAAALIAEKLDDNLPSVHSLLASLYFDNAYDWESAEREYKRVISMTNSMASHSGYAMFLATQGRFDEAIAEVKLGEKIDPSSPGAKEPLHKSATRFIID